MRKQAKRRPIPKFASEDDERDFWAKHDSAQYVDWSKAGDISLPHLRPSTRTISIRLPEPMIARLKVLANKRDIPYQSLLKQFLAERIEQEIKQA